jgi:hypothetical protein
MIGSDDVLACFIAGNVFTWDDWFRLETMDDSLQPTIDMLLNVSVFMWYGAVCPWHKFVANDVVPIYRLIPLGIMVLLFRRLPMVLTYHYLGLIHQIEVLRHALFVGFFGPIGVSAIFYLYISKEFLADILVNGHERVDAHHLAECIDIVVWFLVICSIVVHGLSVPLGKLFFYIPRTISTAISTERISASQSIAQSPSTENRSTQRIVHDDRQHTLPFRRRLTTSERGPALSSPTTISWIPKSFIRSGKHIINDIRRPHGHNSHVAKDETNNGTASGSSAEEMGGNGGAHPEISLPIDPRPIGQVISRSQPSPTVPDPDTIHMEDTAGVRSDSQSPVASGVCTPTSSGRPLRVIQFADEPSGTRSAQARTPRAMSPADEERQSVRSSSE